MDISLEKVKAWEKEVLRSLLEKYYYEFSQYDLSDVNELGLYDYGWLDHYWTEEGRYPFFIKADNKIAGFIMINKDFDRRKDYDYALAEFFVMYKYRKNGVGKLAAYTVFDMFPGKWELKVHPKNVGSECFWHRIIDQYTRGNYEFEKECADILFEDGSPSDIYFFDTTKKGELQE